MLGLTSLSPHAVVPSLLSDEGKRIVLPAFFQRGRDTPDKTRQTLTTAHRGGPTRRRALSRCHSSKPVCVAALRGKGPGSSQGQAGQPGQPPQTKGKQAETSQAPGPKGGTRPGRDALPEQP